MARTTTTSRLCGAVLLLCGAAVAAGRHGDAAAAPCPAPSSLPSVKPGTKPNIVLFLMDDLDKTLGGWTPLNKTTKLLSLQGATAKNWFIHTPVCCPSRAELITGRYFHNIKVAQHQKGCMAADVSPGSMASWLFAPHLRNAGYRVGLFGKYLNSGVPLCAPPGVEKWLANGGGSYYNPSFNLDGKVATFNNGTFANYSTSVIGNISTSWLKEVSQDRNHPFMAYIAPKAPHIQDGPGFPMAEPAPWYQAPFAGVQAPRTPNWDFLGADHHWLIAQQQPMTDEQKSMSDALYRSRWRALLSVDDLVESVINTLAGTGALDSTYFLFTSDHGFRFGQYRMPEGKWNTYDNDIRIPMVFRGPGIASNSEFEHVASNVDVMPTILGLAGVPTPQTMDGRSLAHLLVNAEDPTVPAATRERVLEDGAAAAPWREAQLIEYNGLGNVVRYEHLEDTYNNTFRTLRVINSTVDLMFAEFTDNRIDYNFTADPYFSEFFDLKADPFQLHNLYNSTPASVIAPLRHTLRALFTCRGAATCN